MPKAFRKALMVLALVVLLGAAAALPIAAEGDGSTDNAAATQYGEGEGCTPGYWKNNASKKEGFSWTGTGYTPDEEFDAVFHVDWFPGLTLLQALELGGGGREALARHAVAALLNSASFGEAGYGYSTTEIINLVEESTEEEAETLKDLFAAANETNCPINNS